MAKYKFTTFTYPKTYATDMAGRTIEALDSGVPGLVIVEQFGYDIRKRCCVVHIATAFTFSEHNSIRAALNAAKEAGALCDFTRFKTIRGWTRVVKRDKELHTKLRAIAGR